MTLPAGHSDSSQPAKLFLPGFEDVNFDRLVYADESSHKFWEAGLQDNKLIVRFGRVGTKRQVQVKTFEYNSKAMKEKEKLVKEKLGKGYRA